MRLPAYGEFSVEGKDGEGSLGVPDYHTGGANALLEDEDYNTSINDARKLLLILQTASRGFRIYQRLTLFEESPPEFRLTPEQYKPQVP